MLTLMIPETYHQMIVERINSIYPLDQIPTEKLIDAFRLFNYPRQECLLRKGRKPLFAWFVVSGYVREFTINEHTNAEHTTWFWFPGDFVLPHSVFFNQKDAVSNIDVLSNSILLEISLEDLLSIQQLFPEVQQFFQEIYFYYEKARIEHNENLYQLSGKAKYQKFYAEHPAIFNFAKHRDIASFLGLKDTGFRRYFGLFS